MAIGEAGSHGPLVTTMDKGQEDALVTTLLLQVEENNAQDNLGN